MPKDPASAQVLQQQRTQLVVWWLDRMAAADRPFPERMTWFWHGHFATSIQKVRFADLMAIQNASQRRLGTGDFRALAQAMAVDPAMLIWLDGGGNRVGKPNENLAREFMELFTLGVGNYTEDDVRVGGAGAHRVDGQRPVPQRGLRPASATTPGPRRCSAGPSTTRPSLVNQLVALPVSPQFIAATGVDPVRLRHPAGPRDARHARRRLRRRATTSRRWCGPPHARPPSAIPDRCSSANRCCG